MADTAHEVNDANSQGVEAATEAAEAKTAENLPEAMWYVVHTYSGYENKVMENIQKYVKNNNKEDLIQDVRVPTIEIVKAGTSKESDASATSDEANEVSAESSDTGKAKKKSKETKLFPGYVFVRMVMNPETWYVVRNTRGVTGFVGPDSKPSPLTNGDLERMGLVKRVVEEVPFDVGDKVSVIAVGEFEGFSGEVVSIDTERHKVRVSLYMFNRLTPTEFDISDVKLIEF